MSDDITNYYRAAGTALYAAACQIVRAMHAAGELEVDDKDGTIRCDYAALADRDRQLLSAQIIQTEQLPDLSTAETLRDLVIDTYRGAPPDAAQWQKVCLRLAAEWELVVRDLVEDALSDACETLAGELFESRAACTPVDGIDVSELEDPDV